MRIPFLSKIFEGFSVRSSLANPQQWLLNMLSESTESKAGINISYDTALQVSAVFACVNLKAQTVASLPFHVYKKMKRGKEKADYLAIYDLLQNLPNPETTAFDFWVMYLFNLELTGDAFAYIKRDGNGKIKELWNIPSGNVTIYRNKNTQEVFYKVKDDYSEAESVYYPESIMHTRGMRFKSKDKSLDPIQLARDALGLSVALEEYGSKYFKNGANTGAVIEYPGAMKEDAFIRFKNSFNEKYAGIGNSSKVLFLENGTKYTKIGNNPNESQSLESRKFQVIEIARFFNVPPHKIMDLDRATFSNIEQQSIDFVQSCISPVCVRLEQTVHKDLMSIKERRNYFAKISLNGLLRGDVTARKEFYQAGIQNGWFSPNDVRELEDMNAYEGGDIYVINSASMPIAYIEEFYKQKIKEGGNKNV